MRRICVGITAAIAALGLSMTLAGPAFGGWLISGEEIPAGSRAALATSAKVDEQPKLAAGGVTITCSGEVIHLAGASLVAPSSMEAESIEFTSCSVTSGECGLSTSTIKSVPLHAETTLDGTSAAKSSFSPKTKTILATIGYTGEKCALLGTQPVTGKAVALAPTGQEEKTVQLAKYTSESSLKIGSSSATLQGSSLLTLASGESWRFGGGEAAAGFEFEPEGNGAFSAGANNNVGEHEFKFASTVIKCTGAEFSGKLAAKNAMVVVTPKYTCTGATVNPKNCQYRYFITKEPMAGTWEGSMEIVNNMGTCKIVIKSGECEIIVEGQRAKPKILYDNIAGTPIELKLENEVMTLDFQVTTENKCAGVAKAGVYKGLGIYKGTVKLLKVKIK